MMENPAKDSVYTVYKGGLEELAEELTRYCRGKYGDRCEFYRVSIERSDPDGSAWKIHEHPSFGEETLNAIKRHLDTARDFVRISFGGENYDYELEFIVSKARNANCLARWVKQEHLQEFDDDDIVVLTVEKKRGEVNEEQREFIETVSK